MKRMAVLLVAALLAIAVALPASAHEGIHESSPDDTDALNACPVATTGFYIQFDDYSPFLPDEDLLGLSVVDPTDTLTHQEFHNAGLNGTYNGFPVIRLTMQTDDAVPLDWADAFDQNSILTGNGCHGNIYQCFWTCVDGVCWLVGCNTHYHHCPYGGGGCEGGGCG